MVRGIGNFFLAAALSIRDGIARRLQLPSKLMAQHKFGTRRRAMLSFERQPLLRLAYIAPEIVEAMPRLATALVYRQAAVVRYSARLVRPAQRVQIHARESERGPVPRLGRLVIIVWWAVRILSGPPPSHPLDEISWLLPNGPELAGSAVRILVSQRLTTGTGRFWPICLWPRNPVSPKRRECGSIGGVIARAVQASGAETRPPEAETAPRGLPECA
jgi:hypothetical protein